MEGEEGVARLPTAALNLLRTVFADRASVTERVADRVKRNDTPEYDDYICEISREFSVMSHQRHGVRFLLAQHDAGMGCILADEQGLGKTMQSCLFLRHLHDRASGLTAGDTNVGKDQFYAPSVVVAPNSVLMNWEKELRMWSRGMLNTVLYHGTQEIRSKIGKDIARRVLCGYHNDIRGIEAYNSAMKGIMDEAEELLAKLSDIRKQNLLSDNESYSEGERSFCDEKDIKRKLKALRRRLRELMVVDVIVTSYSVLGDKIFSQLRFKTAIFDEAHTTVNVLSKRYSTAAWVAKQAGTVVLLTGTPLQCHVSGISGYFGLLGCWSETKEIHRAIHKDEKQCAGSTELEQLFAKECFGILRHTTLRRCKDDVLKSVPSMRTADVYVERMDNGETPDAECALMQLRRLACHTMMYRLYFDQPKIRKLAACVCASEKTVRKLLELSEQAYQRHSKTVLEAQTAVRGADISQAVESIEQQAPALFHDVVERLLDFSDFQLYVVIKELAQALPSEFLSSMSSELRFRLISPKITAILQLLDCPELESFTLTKRIVHDEETLCNRHTIVFSQFVDHLSIIEEVLSAYAVTIFWLDGSTETSSRQQIIDNFNAFEGPAVILVSTTAGGVGVNLTSATCAVLADFGYNPAIESQAVCRAHRIGQKNTVYIFRLITIGSIEEDILRTHTDRGLRNTMAVDSS